MDQVIDFFNNNTAFVATTISIVATSFGAGVFLTRKKLFVRNIGDSIVALSDLMDGATADELKKFKDEIIETINAAKSTK